jgi:hypothetical protein
MIPKRGGERSTEAARVREEGGKDGRRGVGEIDVFSFNLIKKSQ